MNADDVKKVIAATRRMAQFNSMVKRGELTQAEADIAIGAEKRLIDSLRTQGELLLKTETGPAKGK